MAISARSSAVGSMFTVASARKYISPFAEISTYTPATLRNSGRTSITSSAGRMVSGGPQVQPHHAAVKGERDHSRTEIPREREPGDDASARLVRNRDIPARDEASARHREEVQDPVARAAADEGLPVPGKGYAAEGLVDRRRGDRPARPYVDEADLVHSVARMQHGRQPAAGIDRHADREVAEADLHPDRVDRPLVVQQREPVGLQPRKRAPGALCPGAR